MLNPSVMVMMAVETLHNIWENYESLEENDYFGITSTDKEVKMVLEMPGIKKEDIKINTYYEKGGDKNCR
jgi:HSP20 family molecular chaperone IbpA